MMINPPTPQAPERSRVSIVERVVPSMSFALASLSGAAAAAWMQLVFSAMRSVENAGYAAFYSAMTEAYAVGMVGLTMAAVVGLGGVATSAVRMFTVNKRSSPPGALFLFPAGLCLTPPLLTDYAGSLATAAVRNPVSGGLSSVSGTIDILNWLTIGVALFSLLFLAAFSFVPFNSRNGRKAAPVLFLVLIEGAVAALLASYALALYNCWTLAQANY